MIDAGRHQHAGLDDLHPRRGEHAAEDDVDDHEDPADEDGGREADAGQRLDQRARAHQLGGEVDAADEQRVDRDGDPHRAPAQAVAEHVGHRELAGVAHPVGQQVEDRQEREHRPQADDPAVEAEEVHEARVAQEGRGRQVVARGGDAVEGAGHAAPGGVEVGRAAIALGGPPGDDERRGEDDREDRDGQPVEVADGGERGGHRVLPSCAGTLVKRASSGSRARRARRCAIRSHSPDLRACRKAMTKASTTRLIPPASA